MSGNCKTGKSLNKFIGLSVAVLAGLVLAVQPSRLSTRSMSPISICTSTRSSPRVLELRAALLPLLTLRSSVAPWRILSPSRRITCGRIWPSTCSPCSTATCSRMASLTRVLPAASVLPGIKATCRQTRWGTSRPRSRPSCSIRFSVSMRIRRYRLRTHSTSVSGLTIPTMPTRTAARLT